MSAFYIDQSGFNSWTKEQDKLKGVVNAIIKEANRVLGKDFPLNYVDLFANPIEYLSIHFFEMVKDNYPEHLEKDRFQVLRDNADVSLKNISDLHKSYLKTFSHMGKYGYAPKLTSKKGFTWRVDQEMFERDIDPKKEELFNALNEYTEAFNKLLEMPPFQMQSRPALLNSFFMQHLTPDGLKELTPNRAMFI